MLGRMIVEYGAPTLCGLKPGSLFAPRMDGARLEREMEALAPGLLERGVRMIRIDAPRGTLLMLARPAVLEEVLAGREEAAFLQALGYDTSDARQAGEQLAQRMEEDRPFPHEVGVFLGYPLEDVVGFIEHDGRDCAAQGAWKVYGDVERAERTFERFARCTQACRQLFDGGVPLHALAAKSVSTNGPMYGMI